MRVRTNGIQINYEMSGKEDAPVVVLSHSPGSSLIMWSPQMGISETPFTGFSVLIHVDMAGLLSCLRKPKLL
jgi:hypothetical protein